MSIRLMSDVWDYAIDIRGNELMLLVIMADYANDDGTSIYPSIKTLARRCRSSERTVYRIIDTLIDKGYILKTQSGGGYETNHYEINKDKLTPVNLSGVNDKKYTPVNLSPLTPVSPLPLTPVSPDPSVDPPDKKNKQKSYSEEDKKTATWIFERLKKINESMKQPNLDRWAEEIRLIRERDKKSHHEICELFDFANKHEFWFKNILSPQKLRKHWDKLTIEMQSDKGKNEKFDRTSTDNKMVV